MLLNDVHSELNATRVSRVVRPASLDEVVAVVAEATASGESLAIAAGRHAMGGQQLLADGVVLDMSALDQPLELDTERGIARVQAGIMWPALQRWLEEQQHDGPGIWTFRQKQTGADTLSLGGAVSANVHGRGLAMAPFIADVEALTIVDVDARVRRIDRTSDPQLFSLVVGGYGLFGVICEVELRLDRRRLLERVVDVIDVGELATGFARRIADGFEYGDWQYDIDPASDEFMRRGVFSCYRAVEGAAPDDRPAGEAALSREAWAALAAIARQDKTRVFELYRAHYEQTHGQRYWSDSHQAATYLDNYAELLAQTAGEQAARETLMISELYVPRARIADFFERARGVLRDTGAEVLYGTVRIIERDSETVLAWAREPWACIIVNLLVEHTEAGRERAIAAFRGLIDAALELDGSYYLTYHRWATDAQLHAAHPRITEFVKRKSAIDPAHVFDSDWYRQVREQVARHAAEGVTE